MHVTSCDIAYLKLKIVLVLKVFTFSSCFRNMENIKCDYMVYHKNTSATKKGEIA